MKSALTAILAAPLALMAADKLPKADTVLDHFVEVTGGKAAYEQGHNQIARGTVEFVGKGIKGPMTEYAQAPDKVYRLVDLEGVGQVEEGSNGTVAWERSALQGPRLKEGKELAEALEEGTFNAPILWRQLYTKVETVGSEEVNGEDCWKVTVTAKASNEENLFFSKTSGLLLKRSGIETTQMGDIPVESYMGDYKESGGVREPATVRQKFAGQEILLRVEDIKVNTEIPPNRFDLPDDIQALVNKAKTPASAAKSEAPAAAGPGRGKLTVYMGGNQVATENYSMESADGKYTWSGTGQAHLGPMQINIEQYKVVTDSSYKPVEAAAKAKMGQVTMEVKTTFADGKARNEMVTPQGPKVKEDAVSPDAVVVSQNLPLFPLSVLARRVSFANGDPQQFHAYVLGQKEVPVTAKYIGKEIVEFANKKVELNHLAGSAEFQAGQPLLIDMWVTDDRQVVKILVPAQKVEVYQDGYERIAPPSAPQPEEPKPEPPKPDAPK